MINGAAYIRVSTDDQAEFSPEAQLKAIRNYAGQNGIALAGEHIYADEGISGKRADKRPAFMKMIGAAKSKPAPFDVILVHKFDRFARSREDSVVYKSLLRKECGIKVVSITESIEDDKFSVILEAMLEAMAEYYSLNLADEVVKGMTEKAERGGLQTSAAFGYDVVDNRLLINEAEARAVRLIFLKFTSREMNVRQLAMMLNETGVRTKRGNLFEGRTVQYILRNPVYIGKLRWSPERAPNAYRRGDDHAAIIRDGGHEPIVDTGMWNAAQQVLAETKELYGRRQRPSAEIRTWLKGLCYCGNCGKALVQNQVSYLQCGGYNKGLCKVSSSIRFALIEQLVLEQLKADFTGEIEISAAPEKDGEAKAEEYAIITDALQKLDARARRVKEAYQSGVDTLLEYRENKTMIDSDKKRLEERLNGLGADFAGNNRQQQRKTFRNICDLLTGNALGIDKKYMAAHFIIEKVTFHRRENLLEIEYK